MAEAMTEATNVVDRSPSTERQSNEGVTLSESLVLWRRRGCKRAVLVCAVLYATSTIDAQRRREIGMVHSSAGCSHAYTVQDTAAVLL
jgi:hypothetical protein